MRVWAMIKEYGMVSTHNVIYNVMRRRSKNSVLLCGCGCVVCVVLLSQGFLIVCFILYGACMALCMFVFVVACEVCFIKYLNQ